MLEDSHLTAVDVMTKDVVTVLPHTSIRHLAKLLAERGISGAPVVNDTGRLLGVVSEHDLLSWDDRPPERQAWWLDMLAEDFELSPDYLEVTRATREAVRSVMKPDPVFVSETTPLVDIARHFLEEGVKRLPVLRDDKVVGIVTRGDLVRALAAS